MSIGGSETRTRILEAALNLLGERHDQGVRMRDVAEATGVSRQAVYLHFNSRTELMVAIAHYVDQVLGLDERRSRFEAATTGVRRLEEYVEFWGNYIPEVYGVARALLEARETDKAAAAAWEDRMGAVRASCLATIEALECDGMLAPVWTREEATDMLWTMLSIRNWEQLTIECGWSTNQYVGRMKKLLKRTFVRETEI